MYKTVEIAVSLYYHDPPMWWRRRGAGYWTMAPEIKKFDFLIRGYAWGQKRRRWKVEAIQPLQELPLLNYENNLDLHRAVIDALSSKVGLPVAYTRPAIILPPKTAL